MILKDLLAAGTIAVLLIGTANADVIVVDPTTDGSYVDIDIGPCVPWWGGCDIDWNLAGGLEDEYFTLDVGASETFDFFEVEVFAWFGAATVAVEAVLALSEPQSFNSGSGGGFFGSFLGYVSGGGLYWEQQPTPIDLGDGTYLGITFENLLEFGIGNRTTVSATVTRYGAIAVSEPGPLVLSVLGLLALAFSLRGRVAS